MRRFFLLAAGWVVAGCGVSANHAAVESKSGAQSPEPSSVQVTAVYIGHSLESDIPDMVDALAGGRLVFKEQFTPGAPLRWQWQAVERGDKEYEPTFQGRYDQIISADTEHLVLIDSVPRGEPASIDESVEYTGRFVEFARRRNPGVQVWWYEPWHHITSGTLQRYENDKHSPNASLRWAPRLEADRKLWDQVVARVNVKHPATRELRLIPAGTGLRRLEREIAQGTVPHLQTISALFDDEIHLNPLGKYFVACIHFAYLFGESPIGGPYEISNRWGGPYWDKADWAGKTWNKPEAATVKRLQEIAWEVVQAESS